MQTRTWQSVTTTILLATSVACGNRSETERANGAGSTDDRATAASTGTNSSSGSVGTSQSSTNSQNPSAPTSGSGTLTGCLQKGSGSDYILTQINAVSASVGTSGNDAAAAGATDQTRSTGGSYVLQGNTDSFKGLVGHQVRVMGTASDTAVASNPAASSQPSANRRAAGDQSDGRTNVMPEFTVTSITDVAVSCGQAGASGQSDRDNPPNR